MHYASRAALFIHCPPRFLSAFRTLPPASQPQTPSSIIFLLVLFGSRRISRRVFAVYTSVPMFSIRISTNYFKVRFLILQPSFLTSFSLFSRFEHVQKPSSIIFPLASFRYLEFTEISLDRVSVQACTVDNVICPDRYRNEFFARARFIKRIYISSLNTRYTWNRAQNFSTSNGDSSRPFLFFILARKKRRISHEL